VEVVLSRPTIWPWRRPLLQRDSPQERTFYVDRYVEDTYIDDWWSGVLLSVLNVDLSRQSYKLSSESITGWDDNDSPTRSTQNNAANYMSTEVTSTNSKMLITL
jgi:hypothetical protein